MYSRRVVAAVRFKVIQTDYDTAVVYQCYGVTDNGKCRRHLEQVDILARQPLMSELTRRRIYDVLTQRLCVDVHDFVKPARGLMVCMRNYTVSKKVPTCKLSVTLSNLDRFSKFFHCWKAYEICYKIQMTPPTSP